MSYFDGDFGKDIWALAAHGALPDRHHSPARLFQCFEILAVASAILGNLLQPEGDVAGRALEEMAVMAVPEAAIDEYDGTVAGEQNVRSPWKFTRMKAVTEAGTKQHAAKNYFKLSICTPDT